LQLVIVSSILFCGLAGVNPAHLGRDIDGTAALRTGDETITVALIITIRACANICARELQLGAAVTARGAKVGVSSDNLNHDNSLHYRDMSQQV